MRFIAKYGRFSVAVRPLIQESFATGERRVLQEQLDAQFHEGALRPEERELAIATWTFNGSYQEQDEATTVAPDYRIGLFDSELAQMAHGWSEEDRMIVEQKLLRDIEDGDVNLIAVPRTLIPPPWPRYDDFTGTPQELVRRLLEDGHNFDAVITYERSMQNRPEVLAALEGSLGTAEGFIDYEPEEEVVG